MNEDRKELNKGKMEMWKKMEELLNSMDQKELKAFIRGYMLGERTAAKKMRNDGCGGGACVCSGASSACGCGKEECRCGEER